MKNKTVLIGLSGGVDSAVAALLLKKQGYKVIAAFMKCFSDTKDPLTGECSWLNDRKDAQKIAAKLEIPFITLDLEKQYKSQIINPMLSAYSKGLTPNPDISCNTIIKFPWLRKEAKKLNIDYIATGHYVKIKKTSKGYNLLAGKDKSKDQSYFLYELSQSDLKQAIFPVGNMKKEDVRKIAKSNKLFNWNKKGTRGICFVGKVNMFDFLSSRIKQNPGIVLNPEGKQIGTHKGISFYTIGQRIHPSIGIDIQKPDPRIKWYVAEKNKNNTIIAAPESHPILRKSKIIIKNLHIINPNEKIPTNLKVRIRHLGKFLQGKITKKKNKYIFMLSKPTEGIAEGQSIVLYKNNIVIGGGEITNLLK